jgi:DNA-binding MarR family transcriptional regulator
VTDILGVVDELAQLSFAVMERLGKVADAHEVSIVVLRLLGILRDREPGMVELSFYLKLDKSSVTGLVDRAERRGLVQRKGREDDRRAVHVSLTPAGRKLAAVIEKEAAREMDLLGSGLTATERTQLVKLATKILGARTPPDAARS